MSGKGLQQLSIFPRCSSSFDGSSDAGFFSSTEWASSASPRARPRTSLTVFRLTFSARRWPAATCLAGRAAPRRGLSRRRLLAAGIGLLLVSAARGDAQRGERCFSSSARAASPRPPRQGRERALEKRACRRTESRFIAKASAAKVLARRSTSRWMMPEPAAGSAAAGASSRARSTSSVAAKQRVHQSHHLPARQASAWSPHARPRPGCRAATAPAPALPTPTTAPGHVGRHRVAQSLHQHQSAAHPACAASAVANLPASACPCGTARAPPRPLRFPRAPPPRCTATAAPSRPAASTRCTSARRPRPRNIARAACSRLKPFDRARSLPASRLHLHGRSAGSSTATSAICSCASGTHSRHLGAALRPTSPAATSIAGRFAPHAVTCASLSAPRPDRPAGRLSQNSPSFRSNSMRFPPEAGL